MPREYVLEYKDARFCFSNFYIEYARFHSDDANILIHLIFVPIILWSLNGMILLSGTKSVMLDLTDGFSLQYIANETVSALGPGKRYFIEPWILYQSIMGILYFYCEPVVGVFTYSAFLIIYWCSIQSITLLGENAFNIFLAVHLFGWISQFIGHGVYEKRAPALLTNLFFINLAPFFVALEVLQIICDYRKKDTDKFDMHVKADIAFYRQKKGYPMMDNIKIKNT